jgi:hypothetical protein
LCLLFDGFPKFVALLAQIHESLIGLGAKVGLNLADVAFKRSERGIHFVDPLLGPI